MSETSLLPEEGEEEAELMKYLGMDEMLTPAEAGAESAFLDAAASDGLRRLGLEERELQRYDRAEAEEHQLIRNRYAAVRRSHEVRRDYFRSYVEGLAKVADFGKKKSRNVGFGLYGRKTVPEKVEVLDPTAAKLWLRTNDPTALRIKEEVDMAQAKLMVLAYVKAHEGEVPPGFDVHPSQETAYAKPEPLA